MEAWIHMLEDETRYARQHETLRANASHLVVIVSGAVLALFAFDNGIPENGSVTWILGLFVFAINVLGIFTSLKHYERARRHSAMARAMRKVLSKNDPLGCEELEAVRKRAEEKHKCKFPFSATRLRVHILWVCIHGILAAFGVALPTLMLIQTGAGTH